MALSLKLKKLREDMGWKQEYLANLMNVDRSTISRYENGRSIPSYQTVIQLAEIYQVDKQILVDELDLLLPASEKAPYILKEEPEQREYDLIFEMLKEHPDWKGALLEVQLLDSIRRSFMAEKLMVELKVLKKYKRV